jgi:hypothetical protein
LGSTEQVVPSLTYFKLPIVFVEPLEPNVNSVLLNVASESSRIDSIRKMLRSASGTQAIASAPVSLVVLPPPRNLGVRVMKPLYVTMQNLCSNFQKRHKFTDLLLTMLLHGVVVSVYFVQCQWL